ncbi:domain containing protein [Rutstroemia sp. NJR-2017a BBW]|nr:domain containing protein [Rutstroemia sp. NJR-2017a BBW]
MSVDNSTMSTHQVYWQPAPPDEPPYPSHNELQRARVYLEYSPAAKRLFWRYEGVFPTAISVMKLPLKRDDLEPYFQPDTEGGGSGTWHDISQLSITEPKVSSIEASAYVLAKWESDWFEWHRDHTGDEFNPQYVNYEDLSDEDRPYAEYSKEDGSWEEDSETRFLVKCCGQDRPLRKQGIKLLVAGNQFVTIHDYISAVHPWLMSLREDIVKAKLVARPQPYSAWEEELMVGEGPEHDIELKEEWLEGRGIRRPFTAIQAASNARILARIRASRGR